MLKPVALTRTVFVLAGILALTLPLFAQQGRGGGRGRGNPPPLGPVNALGQEVRRPPAPTGPAPRLPDGTVDLNGLWSGGGSGNSLAQGLEQGETLPLLPAARKLMESRIESDDPHVWCMPMGVPRSTPYPFRFVQNYTHKAPTTWTARLAAPGDEIMGYICQENNQYGVAGGHQNPFNK